MQVFRHEVLRAARLELGLTQEQTARSLGIDIRTYRRYEAGSVNDPEKGFSVRRAGRRQLLAKIGEELGIAADELVGPAEPDAAAVVPSGHVLPPARGFVGRDDELAALQSWAAAEAPRVLSVVAMGGAGKSSLVQHWLEPQEEAPWVWSFYLDPRPERFIAAVLTRLSGTAAPSSTSEALERLLAVVDAPSPRVLVLDGFEVMQSVGGGRPRGSIVDPLLRRLLTSVAARPGGTRFVVTSRLRLVDLDPWEPTGSKVLMLEALSAAAQRALLRSWGVRGSDAALGRALERFGGHALSVATLGSHMAGAYGGDPSLLGALDLADAGEDDPLAHRLAGLLEATGAALTSAQRDVLARVAVFPRGVGVDTLHDLAQTASLGGEMPTSRRALVQTLSRLEVRGLVHRSADASSRFAVHPVVGEHFRRRVGLDAAAIHEAQRARLRATLDEPPRATPASQQFAHLEDLLVHTRLAGHARDAFNLYQRAFGGFSVLGLQRGDMVLGARLLRGFLQDDDPTEVDPGLASWQSQTVLYELALFACALGDPSFALGCLARFVEAARADPRGHTTGLRTTAYVLRLMGRFDEALSTVQQALLVSADEPDHQVRNLALQGAIRHDRSEFEDAARCFADARAIDGYPRLRRALWEAEHRVERGDVDGALALARENRQVCLRRGWPGHISHCDAVIGRCLMHRDPEAARQAQIESQRWALHSGEVEARLRCYELELALGGDAATRARALGLVEGSGFARFASRLSEP